MIVAAALAREDRNVCTLTHIQQLAFFLILHSDSCIYFPGRHSYARYFYFLHCYWTRELTLLLEAYRRYMYANVHPYDSILYHYRITMMR
jgi:hypothetical protein